MQKHNDSKFSVAYPTLNFGCIHGGDNPNRICDHAELAFDFRNLPPMDMQDFTGQLLARIANRIESLGFKCQLDLMHSPVPAFENPDSILARDIEEITGNRDGAVAFGTEAPFLGELALDTVVIGAGSINQAHQPDEYLPLSQIKPAVNLLQNLIQRYCL